MLLSKLKMSSKLKSTFPLFIVLFLGVAEASESTTLIRVMTSNLSSGNKQNYDGGEGARILKGLKPDVVLIQEFNYKSNSKADLTEFVSTTLGSEFHYYREEEPSDDIPNGIISRFPILESGEWEDANMPNRDFAYARLDIPGEHDLWAISVHLHSKNLTTRHAEAEELVRRIHAIPVNDYVVLGGDFNLTSRQDEIIKILDDEVSEKAAPTDSRGATTTNMNGKKNYDWVLTDADLEKYQVPVNILHSQSETLTVNVNSYPNGLVFDSASFPGLSAVAPILEGDSRAPGMQHLAVVKDFKVPAPTTIPECLMGSIETPSWKTSFNKCSPLR